MLLAIAANIHLWFVIYVAKGKYTKQKTTNEGMFAQYNNKRVVYVRLVAAGIANASRVNK